MFSHVSNNGFDNNSFSSLPYAVNHWQKHPRALHTCASHFFSCEKTVVALLLKWLKSSLFSLMPTRGILGFRLNLTVEDGWIIKRQRREPRPSLWDRCHYQQQPCFFFFFGVFYVFWCVLHFPLFLSNLNMFFFQYFLHFSGADFRYFFMFILEETH